MLVIWGACYATGQITAHATNVATDRRNSHARPWTQAAPHRA
jgi:hypothetical protein